MISFSTDSTNGGCPIGKIKDAEYGGDLQTGPWNRQTVPRSDPPPWFQGFTVEHGQPWNRGLWPGPAVSRSTVKPWNRAARTRGPRFHGQPRNCGARTRGPRFHGQRENRETWNPDHGSLLRNQPGNRKTVEPGPGSWHLDRGPRPTANRETVESDRGPRFHGQPWNFGTPTVAAQTVKPWNFDCARTDLSRVRAKGICAPQIWNTLAQNGY